MVYCPQTLGELIQAIYDEFLAQYNDEELASVATAAVVNDLLTPPRLLRPEDEFRQRKEDG